MLLCSRPARAYAILISLAIAALGIALSVGELSWSTTDLGTLWSLRGGRSLLALGVGGCLAVAGVLLQALFANPLCEPYTLGVSSGAALGAVITGALGWSGLLEGVALGPLLGAVLFTIPLLFGPQGNRLLLMGVLMSFFGSSLVALTIALSDVRGVSQALVWLLGDLSRATSSGAVVAILFGLITMLWVRRRHAELDILLLGEKQARSVGVPIRNLRQEILLASSLMVAVGVAFCGMVGFVGLIIPHAIRRWQGSAHRNVLPMAWILGGVSLVLADSIGRGFFSPIEVPIGVVTALIGVPLYAVWSLRSPHA